MAKKQNASNLLKFVVIVLGIVAVATLFLNVIKITTDLVITEKETFKTGLQVVFGEKVDGTVVSEFSFMSLIVYLCPIVGIVLAFLAKDRGFLFNVLAAAAFVVGIVLSFSLIKNYATACIPMGTELEEIIKKPAREGLIENSSLAIGAIVYIITSALAAIVSVYRIFVKKSK